MKKAVPSSTRIALGLNRVAPGHAPSSYKESSRSVDIEAGKVGYTFRVQPWPLGNPSG